MFYESNQIHISYCQSKRTKPKAKHLCQHINIREESLNYSQHCYMHTYNGILSLPRHEKNRQDISGTML